MFINESTNKGKRFNVLPWEILFRFLSLPWQERENCMLTFLRETVISIFIFFPPIKYKYEVTEDDFWMFIFDLLQSFFVLLYSWKSYVQAISLMLQREKQRPYQWVISLSSQTREGVQGGKSVLSEVKSLSHVWLCDPVDCSLPGSSVHGILQAIILEGVTISFSRGSSRPRDRTQVSSIGGRHFNLWPPGKPQKCLKLRAN